MSWINPEPIAPAAPILVHGEVQDGCLQQHGAEDRINIELVSSNEQRLPIKEPSSASTAACVGQEADDRIDILEFELNNERQPGKAATPATLHAPDPVTLKELEEDPQYHCVRAQIDPPHQSWNHCCQSCRNFFMTSQTDKLQRAYNTGWAMLMSSVFPLVPNHTLRCFWVLCQLMFAIPLIILSSQQLMITGQESTLNCTVQFNVTISELYSAAVVNTLLALPFLAWACCDILACFLIAVQKYFSQQQNQQPHEAEPLLHYNGRTSCMSCYKNWLHKYSDVLRLVVIEIVMYLILVSPTITSSRTGSCSPWMLGYSAATFLILVYVTQLLFFAKFTIHLWSQMKPPTRNKAMWLLFRFFVHFVGYRICQTLLVVLLISIPHPLSGAIGILVILTYLTPVVGILTFFALKHGWIYDLCIVYCTDYLSYLNTIQCNPNTGQETRRSIQTALTKFEFETLMTESHKYKLSRSFVNFAYPSLSIRVILLSLPNAFCLIALLTFGALAYGSTSISPSLFTIIVFLLLVNNNQLILVLILYLIFIGARIHSLVVQRL